MAVRKSGRRNSARSSIGARPRASTATKAATSRTPSTSGISTAGRTQPVRPAVTATSSSASPAPRVSTPATSTRAVRSARDSASSRPPNTASTADSTASTRYNQRQLPSAVRTAEASGPTAMPAPSIDAQRAVAWDRPWWVRKACPSSPSPAARIAALAAPCTTRAATKVPESGATAAPTVLTASSARPARKIRRRPKSSPRLPATSRVAASPSVIALINQVWVVRPAPRLRAVCGRTATGAV